MSGAADDGFGDLAVQLIDIAEGPGGNVELHGRLRQRLGEAAKARGGRFATEQVLIALIQRSQSAKRYFEACQTLIDHMDEFDAAVDVADGPRPPGGFDRGEQQESGNVVLFPGSPA